MKTSADELNGHIETLGDRLRAVEAERDRYRAALIDALGCVPADQPEHMRIARLLSGTGQEPFRYRDAARKGQR